MTTVNKLHCHQTYNGVHKGKHAEKVWAGLNKTGLLKMTFVVRDACGRESLTGKNLGLQR